MPEEEVSVLVEVEIGGGLMLMGFTHDRHKRAVGPFPTADAARQYADNHPIRPGQGYWLRVPFEGPS